MALGYHCLLSTFKYVSAGFHWCASFVAATTDFVAGLGKRLIWYFWSSRVSGSIVALPYFPSKYSICGFAFCRAVLSFFTSIVALSLYCVELFCAF